MSLRRVVIATDLKVISEIRDPAGGLLKPRYRT
uniref:Uncharacterized protein n=1 Tax=Anguilla anguilla TaxID=7936 RepID=A0A0E9W258_ANGAN